MVSTENYLSFRKGTKIDKSKVESLNHYSRTFRMVEYLSLFAFAIMWLFHFYKSFILSEVYGVNVAISLVVSWLVADFISGVVHWFADTWGTAEWPVVGPTLIRSFRLHHIDAGSITEHDFVETNGASALVCLPVLIGLFFYESYAVFLLFFTFWILLTNQFHKWSHEREVSQIVGLLQRCGLILGRVNHARHHHHDHNDSYFITNGFFNHLIGRRCFKTAEIVVSKFTGLKPREDDLHSMSMFLKKKK